MAGDIGDERLGSRRDNNRGQGADRIAQLGCGRFPVVAMAVEVDEAALLVDVDQRVDERALPRREQRDG